MINQKFSKEELNNIKNLEQSLNKDNKNIRIEPNTSKTLRFVLSEKMGPVKTISGKPFQQYRFIAIEVNTDNIPKRFDVGKRLAAQQY